MPVSAEGEEKAAEAGGRELLYCGTVRFDIMGRAVKGGVRGRGNLVSPTRLRPVVGVDIRFVASGCAACHCVALSSDGRCFSWGRNEKGQLGHGDTLLGNLPTVVSALSKYNMIAAGVGRNHTVVVTDDGKSFAFGDNRHGQLGMGSLRSGSKVSPVPCLVTKATNAVCGAEFTVWLSSVEGSSILTAGLPQYGQLGHGSDNEYNANASSVRLAYDPQPHPKAIAALSGKTVVKVACGTNHTVAVDSSGFVYTWGFGGYGRLGHNEQKDEWQPRLVEIFQKNNILSPSDIISAGSASSACTAGGCGQLYMWGKLKNLGDECMYPKPVRDLRSSVNPKKVDILEGMHVTSVGCGVGMSLIVVDRANVGDKLDQLDNFDGDIDALFQENTKKIYFVPRLNIKEKPKPKTSQHPAVDEAAEETQKAEQVTKAASPTTNPLSKKRKKASEHAETEAEDEIRRVPKEEAECGSHGRGRGRGRGRSRGRGAKTATPEPMPSGRGRGRPKGTGSPGAATTPEAGSSGRGGKKSGKRGRPRK